MTKRVSDPRRLDVAAFADAAGELLGQWPLTGLRRLADTAHRDASAGDDEFAHWEVRGEKRSVTTGPAQVWLHLSARAKLSLLCQRCLQPTVTALEVRRSYLFVQGEAAAAELDAQCEDDVLALGSELDLRELVEDELLLSLPLIPKHEQCQQPLPGMAAAAGGIEPPPGLQHPFAALAVLKRSAIKAGSGED
ncbi:MAG: DUF177 domain-containing protein [Burkholderiaceae bacterium]